MSQGFINDDNIVYPIPLSKGGTGSTSADGALTNLGKASKQEMISATSDNKIITPSVAQHHPSSAKVWVFFSSVNPTTIFDSYNVSSLTDLGVGMTRINFLNPFASRNYAMSGNCSHGTASTMNLAEEAITPANRTVSSLTVTQRSTISPFTLTDVDSCSVILFGVLA